MGKYLVFQYRVYRFYHNNHERCVGFFAKNYEECLETNEIISENYHYDKRTTTEIKILVKMELSNLTFDGQYKSCFGNRPKNLYQQASEKLQCFRKYGDPIL